MSVVNTADIDGRKYINGTQPGYRHVSSSGVGILIKSNLSAVVDPVAADDSTQNFAVGSEWINLATQKVFKAVDVTPATAVWKDLSATTLVGGSNQQLLFNDAGSINGIAGSTWDGTTLSIPNLIVTGTTTTVNATNLNVSDPLIKLAKDNPADLLDIGFYGLYISTGSKYAGLFRDATDGKFKLFTGLTEEPTTTVNTASAGYTYANLSIGDLSLTMSSNDKSGVSDYYKSRGTVIAPTEIVVGDYIHSQRFYGYGPSGYRQTAEVSVISEGTLGVNRVPSRIVFSTATDDVNNTLTERMSIGSTGFVVVNDSLTVLGTLTSATYANLPVASAVLAGVVSTGTQTFAGEKLLTASGYGWRQTNGTTTIGIYTGGGLGQIGTSSNHPFELFANNGAVSVHISTAGLVGINKASSIGAQLHVVSSSPTVVTTILQGAVAQSVGHLQIIQGTGTITGNFISCTSSGGAEGGLFKVGPTGEIHTTTGISLTTQVNQCRISVHGGLFGMLFLAESAYVAKMLSTEFRLGNTKLLTWSDNVPYAGTTVAGLGLNAAGIVEVNNGTAGSWAALKCSTVHFMNGSTTRIPYLSDSGYNVLFSGNLTFNGTTLGTRALIVTNAATTENAIIINGPTNQSVPLLKINMGLTSTGNVIDVFTSLAASVFSVKTTGLVRSASLRSLVGQDLLIAANGNNRIYIGSTSVDEVDTTFEIALQSPTTVYVNLTFYQGTNIVAPTTTGMKFGTGVTQKMAWWDAAPVVQPTAVADATGGANIDTECRAALNALLARQRTIGMIAV